MGDMADYHSDLSQLIEDWAEDAMEAVHCPYCHKPAEHVDGSVIYPHRPELKKLWFYRCKPCNAYVGCHKDSGHPFGSLANAELRKARSEAHMFFDKLWRFSWSGMTRNQAYKWLRGVIDCSKEDCHIAKFDLKQCKKAAELSRLKLAELVANK